MDTCRGVILMVLVCLLSGRGALAVEVQFNRDIRPILSDNCFACHGPDKNKREADLRLDTQEGLFAKPKHGPIVTPGKPDQSELFKRITTHNSEERMPPVKGNKKLDEEQTQLLRKWIEQGAPFEGHWTYNPIVRQVPSQVEDRAGFVRSPIDALVLLRLGEHGLKPSPEADRVTLIRRLSFDLTGLPPTSEQVQKFVDDRSEQAYEKVVDSMLASPHYGERMAQWWLDLIRYADSVGYHGDQPVTMYPLRDYVIEAFNTNMPFDRFTIEQIAGDLLPNATVKQKVAASYNRMNMMSAEGGGQDKEYHAKYASDRVRATSGAWLGATLGCAECHNHKFDPYTTKDFYRFEAFFADVTERGIYSGSEGGNWGEMMKAPTTQQIEELERRNKEIAETQAKLQATTPELLTAAAAWEVEVRPAADWIVIQPMTATATEDVKLTIDKDGSILSSGANPEAANYTITAKLPLGGVTGFKVEALPHDSLPKKGPGRAASGNFVLTGFCVKLTSGESIPLENPSATFEQKHAGQETPRGKWDAAAVLEEGDKGGIGWAILPEVGKAQHAVFQARADVAVGEGAVTFVLEQNHGNGHHTLGRFRILATTQTRPIKAGGPVIPPNIAAIIVTTADKRTESQKRELLDHYRTISPLVASIRQQVARLTAERDRFEGTFVKMPGTVAMAKPRIIRILPRGNWMDDSGEIVTPGVPAFLPQPKVEPADRRLTRLDLAKWIVDKENPLTARVFVNRVWRNLFGAGISRRLDDLGAQGEWPSHPLLLDWIAWQFVDSGWDVKRTVKLIVMSSTYRQSSLPTAEAREKDPYNRWLSHQGRFRIDAEFVRDTALDISGLMRHKLGGPSVKPYQPPGYWAYLNFPAREWQADKGESLYRRGLYTHWQRQYLHPSMLAFDAPSREECVAERVRSNTPLQALVLLNDPIYVEAARVFAARIINEGGKDPGQRIAWAFRQATSRAAKPAEISLLHEIYSKHLDQYKQDPTAARELLTTGASPAPKDIDPAELAAWTSVARIALNLHETVTRN